VLEPLIFTIGVATLWTLAGMANRSPMPIVAFAITGYSSVLLWRNTVSRCNAAIEQNFGLLFHRNVRAMDVYATRILLELGGGTASFMLLGTAMVVADVISIPQDMLLVIAGWLLLAWFGAALAAFVGSAASFSDIVERIWHPITYLMFPLSGAAFMVDWLPPAGQEVVLWLPMVHCVEMIRDGFYGHLMSTHYDVGYVVASNLVLSLLGLVLLRLASRRVKSH
jgi:capsular polysaccharide transport system permease protein